MRIAITLVIEMSDQQVKDYADAYGLPLPIRAKDIVDDVRRQVLTGIQDSTAFGDGGADVSIKR